MNWKHAQLLISVRRFTLVLSLILVGMLALTKSQPMAAGDKAISLRLSTSTRSQHLRNQSCRAGS